MGQIADQFSECDPGGAVDGHSQRQGLVRHRRGQRHEESHLPAFSDPVAVGAVQHPAASAGEDGSGGITDKGK